jgi:hypothetical protein
MKFNCWTGQEIVTVEGPDRQEAARRATARNRNITAADLRPYVPVEELCSAKDYGVTPCLYRRKVGPLCGRHERQRAERAERRAYDTYRRTEMARRRTLLERLGRITGVSMVDLADASTPLSRDVEALANWCERLEQAAGVGEEALRTGAMGMGGPVSLLGAAEVLRHARAPWKAERPAPALVEDEHAG